MTDVTTANYGLVLPEFDQFSYHRKLNPNFTKIDSIFKLWLGVTTYQGVWDNSTAYALGDFATDDADGQVYYCTAAHTSPTSGTFAADRSVRSTRWALATRNTQLRGAWATGTPYYVGDWVYSGNIFARCTTSHTSGTGTFASESANWEYTVDLTSSVNSAASSATAAAASATAAASSASAASTSASAASTSATAAASSASAASTSASSASTSASNASTSATNAATSATSAASSATSASSSASAASTSASSASTDATSAAASAAAAAAAASGYDMKQSCRVASTANVTVSNPGTSSFDGVTLTSGDRVLLKDQSTASQNGIYTFNGSSSAMTRTTDADASSEVTSGMTTFISEGSTNALRNYTLVTPDPITLGSTNLTFSRTGPAITYTGSSGISLVSTDFRLDMTSSQMKEAIVIAPTDETTVITAGTQKATFRMPYAFTLTAVRASLKTGQTGGSLFTVDINESGTSILSTKITIDNNETTSTTAATPPVISDASLADDAEITVDVDTVGSGSPVGLKVTLIGYKT